MQLLPGEEQFMSSTANIGCFKSRHEMFKTQINLWHVKLLHKTQKILQLKDVWNLEVSKFMYKCTNC